MWEDAIKTQIVRFVIHSRQPSYITYCAYFAQHISSAFTHPSSLHTHTHPLSLPPLLYIALFPLLPLSLVGRLMQWLIVWEVPLSSLAGLEALVRGHIRSFLWSPLCLASHEETQWGVSGTHLTEGIHQWRSKPASRKLGWAISQHVCHKDRHISTS